MREPCATRDFQPMPPAILLIFKPTMTGENSEHGRTGWQTRQFLFLDDDGELIDPAA